MRKQLSGLKITISRLIFAQGTAARAETPGNDRNTNTSITNANAESNANRATNTGQFNVQAALDAAKTNNSTRLGAAQGATSLYGTTPALTNTFGNQVTQAGQLGLGQQDLNNRKLITYNNLGGGR